MKVVITRPNPDAELFAEECRAKGLDPVIAPLMTIAPRDDWTAPTEAGALAFTSANGVRAFAAASRVRSLTAFCVGEATADAAHAEGFTEIVVADGDVVSLAETIAAQSGAVTGQIVHIAGTRLAGDLLHELTTRGLKSRRVVAYETHEAATMPEPAKSAISSGRAVAVTLFSPRTARLFLALAESANLTEALARCRAVCLSEAVAEIASEAAWRIVDVASERNGASMLALMTARP